MRDEWEQKKEPKKACSIGRCVAPSAPQLIAFHTPLMPMDVVAGAARWSELVLACPALYAEAVARGVLRMGLWGPLAMPAGPTIVPAPLPLNFAAASPRLVQLLLACAWHEANRRESPYLMHRVHASGKLSVAVGGKYNMGDLAGVWGCSAAA